LLCATDSGEQFILPRSMTCACFKSTLVDVILSPVQLLSSAACAPAGGSKVILIAQQVVIRFSDC
ncbi:hypothetical protein, partial [Herminiimonas sp. KBW02]|uniref:hypothetical protein n=1 Tax=Herminiimonas sp. KBW02 TaxID=2153363 RepID=UPI001F339B4A